MATTAAKAVDSKSQQDKPKYDNSPEGLAALAEEIKRSHEAVSAAEEQVRLARNSLHTLEALQRELEKERRQKEQEGNVGISPQLRLEKFYSDLPLAKAMCSLEDFVAKVNSEKEHALKGIGSALFGFFDKTGDLFFWKSAQDWVIMRQTRNCSANCDRYDYSQTSVRRFEKEAEAILRKLFRLVKATLTKNTNEGQPFDPAQCLSGIMRDGENKAWVEQVTSFTHRLEAEIKTIRSVEKHFKEFLEFWKRGTPWQHSPEFKTEMWDAGFNFKPIFFRHEIFKCDRLKCSDCGGIKWGLKPWHDPLSFHTPEHRAHLLLEREQEALPPAQRRQLPAFQAFVRQAARPDASPAATPANPRDEGCRLA